MNTPASISIRPADLDPVVLWLHDVRSRVERWSQEARTVTAEEWKRLQKTLTSAIAMPKVESVLREFLGRLGVSARSSDAIAAQLVLELREKILHYREGFTIEAYQNHLLEPPRIEV